MHAYMHYIYIYICICTYVYHIVVNNSEQQITMSTMEGSLSKWTNVVNGWQYRWFVLDDNAGLLSYYTVRIFEYYNFCS